ncbi:SpaH/EbpB family LPXTG-anchored major pilin [Gardnerella vaginalis]|uniref:LPXTG-motif cell wall anchor domain protein n=1 Tax=Gardnerella vaginalis (strain ATCC 14019 / 317) TaxID=525284 RepID=E3D727_GARV3|nr:SpaH/EbpB family LPXTG-anchored major pilin [Gardnerella vaginalis]ADP39197.1 LPXTG-motif cell wall anchor domain protein [Gardnerella vaginalis ATCC 14019]EIK75838.1 putative fimbrial subunit [Gardnerella vaginalis 284V]KOS09613.1 peptidase [Gardnerella vaginalis]TCH79792.1 LPXTG cell wall anchor domain-containing protein [Gardnerella vaginalis]TCH81612.1 LPXTG cell wall anchor domain-containing protein [Gardnerella vaginalis ATCC 14018 = JCM 11026]
MNKFTKQCVAAVASLAMAGTLCVAGAVVAGSSAWAATAEKAPWALGNEAANKKGSITITKYKDEVNDQGEQTKKTKVTGAKFKVTKVKSLGNANLDLTKYDEWLKVAAKVPTLNLTPNTSSNIAFEDKSSEQATNNEGIAKFPDLGIGLYKVEETEVPDGYEKLPDPFFMTIPEVTRKSNSTDNTYNYDVTVDPKNAYTKDAIKKTVDTKGMVGAGDVLPYTIETAVVTKSGTPVKDRTADDYKGFAVWDDALSKAYDSSKTVVKKVMIGNTEIKNTKGKEDKYTVSVADSPVDNQPAATRKRITVSFTDAGLGEIATALKTNANAKLKVELEFTLKAGVGTGEVVNKFGYQPGYKKGTPEQDKPKPVNPNPGDESKVTLVKFNIKKVNGIDGTSPLAGAKFAIFASENDAKACAADLTRSDDKCKNKSAKGFANGENGTPATGLTTAFEAKAGQEFYVVETKAPEKFALSPAVDKVTIPKDYTKNANYKAADQTFTYSFKDLPNGGPDGGNNWFKLPKTGAAGVIIFALIGLGLVGSGMFVFLKNRKKEEEQQAA